MSIQSAPHQSLNIKFSEEKRETINLEINGSCQAKDTSL
jgi:hypothetical protein